MLLDEQKKSHLIGRFFLQILTKMEKVLQNALHFLVGYVILKLGTITNL